MQNDVGEQEVGVVFVSVHLDGDPDAAKFGTFVIYSAPEMPNRQSKRSYRVDSTLAQFVAGPLQSNAAAAFLGCHNDMEPRQDVRGLHVLKKAKVRSVLVECCFLSNQCQFNNIVQNGDQGLIANGIATGISNYLGTGPRHRTELETRTARTTRSVLSGVTADRARRQSVRGLRWRLVSSGGMDSE